MEEVRRQDTFAFDHMRTVAITAQQWMTIQWVGKSRLTRRGFVLYKLLDDPAELGLHQAVHVERQPVDKLHIASIYQSVIVIRNLLSFRQE